MERKNILNSLPDEYRPLSPWAYFGYGVLFSVPVIGLIFLIVFSFSNKNINRRNYARSYFCIYAVIIIILVICCIAGASFYEAIAKLETTVKLM